MAIVEKIERSEYRTMHFTYQITASLDKEQFESEESLWVMFSMHCPQVEKSLLHMNSP